MKSVFLFERIISNVKMRVIRFYELNITSIPINFYTFLEFEMFNLVIEV